MTPSRARRPVRRAAGRGGPPDPPGPRTRARRGPGGLHPRLAEPAHAPRSGSLRGLAPPLVARACIDIVRRRGRRPIEVELSPVDGPAIGDIASVVADRELLELALRRLRPEQRAVIVLHYYLGMSLPETAAALGHPDRDRQVPSSPIARDHARGDRCRHATPVPRSPEGSWHDRLRPHRARACPSSSMSWRPRASPTTSTTCSRRPPGLASAAPERP